MGGSPPATAAAAERPPVAAAERESVADAAPNVTPPPGNPRFPLFDLLRAIAALTVFLGHTLDQTHAERSYGVARYSIQLGAQGVAIFFLISGFLLYRPFLVARVGGPGLGLGDYARRRFLRIVPAYWAALTILVLVGRGNGIGGGNWLTFYGFRQIYDPATTPMGIGAAWTLCVEVTFYAALPVFALLAAAVGGRRRGLKADMALLIVLSAASLAYHQHVYSSPATAYEAIALPGSFLWFALGMGLAVASVAEERRARPSPVARFVAARPTLPWAAAIGIFALLCALLRHPNRSGTGSTPEHVLYGLAALLILIPAVFRDAAGGLARRVLRLRTLAWIGLVSYGFYLWHTTVLDAIVRRLDSHHAGHPYPIVLVAGFLGTALCAAASFYLLERPILRLKNVPLRTLWRRLRPARAPVA